MWPFLPLVLSTLAAEPAHHRGDGLGRFAGSSAPSLTETCWTRPAPSWSNAGPLHVADKVCALAEPTTVWCVDAETGALAWKTSVDVMDGLTGPARDAALAARADAEAAEQAARELRVAFSRTRRAVRKDPALAPELDRIAEELRAVHERLDAGSAYLAPPVKEIVGYTSHGPVTDGEHVYVQLGTGVVASLTHDGARRWTTWLGAPPPPRRGYHLGTSSTPLMVDDLLIVGHEHLVALVRATGEIRWRSDAPWALFGSPTLAEVEGVTLVITPDGRAVDARDGRVVLEGMTDTWFVGPATDGPDVVWVGREVQDPVAHPEGLIVAEAWRLTRDGERWDAKRRWRTELPTRDAVYNAAVAFAGAWWVADAGGAVWRIGRDDGRADRLGIATGGPAYASPVVLGGELVVTGDEGLVRRLDAQGDLQADARLGAVRATPVAVGRRTVLRTLDALVCLEPTR